MCVAVRVVFVGHGNADVVGARTPTSTEILVTWTPITAAPTAARLPSPPKATTWERALENLRPTAVLYLAPGHGTDDDPGIAVLRELADSGVIRLTVGPDSAPAVNGPTVTGPARAEWRPAPAMQTVVRGVADDGELDAWRNRLRAAYGPDAAIEVRSWSCSKWCADDSDALPAFPASLRALPTEQSRLRDTNTLRDIMRRLRGPDGCPWDRSQTHRTLRPYLVEEAHEALAAIELDDDAAMADEFGDVLLNLVLHAEIARQRGGFSWPDVVGGISAKMIRRHPHVFGDEQFETMGLLCKTWAQIKADEQDGARDPLDSLPDSMPSLAFARAAVRVMRRTGRPLDEPMQESDTLAALAAGSDAESLGNALLWVAARADAFDIDLDMALRDANARLRKQLRNERGWV